MASRCRRRRGRAKTRTGSNEVGTLPGSANADVWVRDTGSGELFGPFPSGTRIKYVEANGAQPSMSPMGGNNGKGKGRAQAVDYQIRGQGDMEIVTYDEHGEVTTLCLVPPFPKYQTTHD